jgi:hypothetical protein
MECTLTPYPFGLFTFGLAVEFIRELGGASSTITTRRYGKSLILLRKRLMLEKNCQRKDAFLVFLHPLI